MLLHRNSSLLKSHASNPHHLDVYSFPPCSDEEEVYLSDPPSELLEEADDSDNVRFLTP